MFLRLTFITAQQNDVEKLKHTFNNDVVPVVKSQKGNAGIRLLEPADGGLEYISLSEWHTAADAEAYEESGTYRRLVDSLKDFYTNRPVLKSYNVIESEVMEAMH